MSHRLQQRLSAAAAARRIVHAPRPRRASFSSSRRLRWWVAAAVLLSAVFVQAPVTRAFLGIDPAGWVVVTQMSALVTQMTAIKRQVENYRDQTRAYQFGKLAPLDGKLDPTKVVLDATLNPARTPWYTPPGLPPLETEPVNQPFPECGTVQPGTPCMPDAEAAELSEDARAAVIESSLEATRAIFGGSVPTYVAESSARLADTIEYRTEYVRERREAAANRRAQHRAVVDMSASVLEEWRGCNQATEATPYTQGSVARPPCMSRNGEGRGESLSDGETGTEGMVETLSAGLAFVEATQEGDASLTQLATMETQVNLMRGRLQAAELELDLAEAAQRQRLQLEAEAAQRRRDELANLRIECRQTNSGGTVYNIFVPNYEDPALSTCVLVEDVTDEQLAILGDPPPLYPLQ